MVKKLFGSTIPFLLFHLVCCGGLLILLTTSGILLTVRQEGTNKFFLIPALFIAAVFIWFHHRHNKQCEIKGQKTMGDYIVSIILYAVFSIILGLIFMIYVFIPWWIPGYKGGLLLP